MKQKLDRRRAAKRGYGKQGEDRTMVILTCAGCGVLALILVVLLLTGGGDGAVSAGTPAGRSPGDVTFLSTAQIYFSACHSMSMYMNLLHSRGRIATKDLDAASAVENVAYSALQRASRGVKSSDLAELRRVAGEVHRGFSSGNMTQQCARAAREAVDRLEDFTAALKDSIDNEAERREADFLQRALRVGRMAWGIELLESGGADRSVVERQKSECKRAIEACQAELIAVVESKHSHLVEQLRSLERSNHWRGGMGITRSAIEGMFKIDTR